MPVSDDVQVTDVDLDEARQLARERAYVTTGVLQRVLRFRHAQAVKVAAVLIEEGLMPDRRQEELRAVLESYGHAARAHRWYMDTGFTGPYDGWSCPADAHHKLEDARRAALRLGATPGQLAQAADGAAPDDEGDS